MLVAVLVDAVTLAASSAPSCRSAEAASGGGGVDASQAAVVTESVAAGLTLPDASTARTE